jgi:hypothetical protein
MPIGKTFLAKSHRTLLKLWGTIYKVVGPNRPRYNNTLVNLKATNVPLPLYLLWDFLRRLVTLYHFSQGLTINWTIIVSFYAMHAEKMPIGKTFWVKSHRTSRKFWGTIYKVVEPNRPRYNNTLVNVKATNVPLPLYLL